MRGVILMEFAENMKFLFYPRSVAVIGASNQRKKWGFRVLDNIISGGFEGKIFPINKRENEIHGLKAFPNIKDVSEPVDLAVIIVPQDKVYQAFEDCIQKEIKAAVLITAGFGEIGPEGLQEERRLVQLAKENDMAFVGPNGNGIVSNSIGLFSWMMPLFPMDGSVSMVTQSGNIGVSMLSRGIKNGIGFSKYVSSGNEALLRSEDFIDFYGQDPETKVILTYIEGLNDGRRFLNTCKEVSQKKPILVFKSGRTQSGEKAANSHTGSMAGSDQIFEGICRQAGMIRCYNLDMLFDVTTSLLSQPLPKGDRIGIITSGGGWGVLICDACESKGLEVASFSDNTIQELDNILPPWWSRDNPIDLVAGTSSRNLQIRSCIETLFENDEVDAIIVSGIGAILDHKIQRGYILDEQEKLMLEDENSIGDTIINCIDHYQRPIIPITDHNVFVDPEKNPLYAKLKENGILILSDPERAVNVLFAMYSRYRYLYQKENKIILEREQIYRD